VAAAFIRLMTTARQHRLTGIALGQRLARSWIAKSD